MSEVALKPGPALRWGGIVALALVCLPKWIHFREISDFTFTRAGIRPAVGCSTFSLVWFCLKVVGDGSAM